MPVASASQPTLHEPSFAPTSNTTAVALGELRSLLSNSSSSPLFQCCFCSLVRLSGAGRGSWVPAKASTDAIIDSAFVLDRANPP